ncbi:MAG TPA: RNA-directed DNA polymerase [Sulfurimonas sp.]|uniref:RNA-directed DNA polymerase n=1 Tax=Sulfurimonas sp. TaxID=2022749 RepID=UPI002BE06A2C|nr:RNA-directed DNA polymerase [Sulfurimonas sp.]HUH42901.1 RNA-directed DNA polymerase [Sulfurimonas sp.]
MITLNDLYIAYKKTKYELFKDEKSNALLNLYAYEDDIHNNINRLASIIKTNDFKSIDVGQCYEVPKALKPNKKDSEEQKSKVHFHSNSIDMLQKKVEDYDFDIELRKIFVSDIDFHILSTLWIMKIGQFIDESFSKNIYGSRVQREKDDEYLKCIDDITPFSLKSPKIFKPYQRQYQNWRNNSFKTVEENHPKSSIVVITMDISNFFPSVNLDEFTDDEFYDRFDLNSIKGWDNGLKEFHESFIILLKRWNKEKANSDNDKDGLPIGLTASHILANAILKTFDDEIEKDLEPLYYGRYVDDVILVLNRFGQIEDGSDILNFLESKIKSISTADIGNDEEKEEAFQYNTNHQTLYFKNSKQKIFYFDKDSDLSILKAIKKEINSISSEWRFVPDLVDNDSSLLDKVIGFSSDGKEFSDSFRKVDTTSIKKLGLALLISHSNMTNQYILSSSWRDRRYEIYDLIENHIFLPESFIENNSFINKIFRLMITSEDFYKAICFLNKIVVILNILDKKNTLKTYRSFLAKLLYESLIFCIDLTSTIKEEDIQNIIKQIKNISDIDIAYATKEGIQNQNSLLFFKDLSYKNYASEISSYILDKDKNSLISKLIESAKQSENKTKWISNKKVLEYFIFEGLELDRNYWEYNTINTLQQNIVCSFLECKELNVFNNENFFDTSALLFPTRTFSPLEISIVFPEQNSYIYNTMYLDMITLHKNQIPTSTDSKNETITVKYGRKEKNPKVAIANLHMSDKYFYSSIKGKVDLSKERYKSLLYIINQAMKLDIDYLVLPELSLPRKWAVLFAKKLLTKKISLITGVEYLHEIEEKQKVVRNSIFSFLVCDDTDYNYHKFFRQDKTTPAHGERESLRKKSGLVLKADENYKEKHIYNHGDFYFSSLICNEFTDINHRANLRGKIDALMIVEWNQDTKYFNALVESASFDLHSYIVQVNNRAYGDSRIRGPYKEDYDRDIVKIKGGFYNHIVVGKLDIKALREFQSDYISPSKEFKPVPTGFENERG